MMQRIPVVVNIRADLVAFARACAGGDDIDAIVQTALQLLQARVLELEDVVSDELPN